MKHQASDEDRLFHSAAGMAGATNYTDWTFTLFAPYVRGRVLEVGCGVGTFTRRLAAAPGVESLLSIDISADAVVHCNAHVRHPLLRVIQSDVLGVNGLFDLIVCMNVLEHIEADTQALAHMLRLLGPGATLFLLVPAHEALNSAFDREAGHYRRYSKSRMARVLGEAAGSRPLTVTQFYFNSIGALGYYAVYRLLKKAPRADATSEVGWFDRLVVPVLRRIEGNRSPFGISLVTIVRTGQV